MLNLSVRQLKANSFRFEFDIEHIDIHDEHIMDYLSYNRIIQSRRST